MHEIKVENRRVKKEKKAVAKELEEAEDETDIAEEKVSALEKALEEENTAHKKTEEEGVEAMNQFAEAATAAEGRNSKRRGAGCSAYSSMGDEWCALQAVLPSYVDKCILLLGCHCHRGSPPTS